MTTETTQETTRVSTTSVTTVTTVTTRTGSPRIVLSEADYQRFVGMLEELRTSLCGSTPDTLADVIAEQLAAIPGSASADALRPLVKNLPPAVAARLPEYLEAEGTVANTAILSHLSKDVMFRTETAIAYGSAFLVLTDLTCDPTRSVRGS